VLQRDVNVLCPCLPIEGRRASAGASRVVTRARVRARQSCASALFPKRSPNCWSAKVKKFARSISRVGEEFGHIAPARAKQYATVADVLHMGRWKVRSRARVAIAIPVIATSAFVLTPKAAHAALARADAGYRVSDASGTVLAFGSKKVSATFLAESNGRVVGMASTP